MAIRYWLGEEPIVIQGTNPAKRSDGLDDEARRPDGRSPYSSRSQSDIEFDGGQINHESDMSIMADVDEDAIELNDEDDDLDDEDLEDDDDEEDDEGEEVDDDSDDEDDDGFDSGV